MVAGHLHEPLQSAAQVVRPSVLRTLQVADRGWFGQRLSQNSLRLRSPESGAGEARRTGAAAEEFSLEQLAGVSGVAIAAAGLAAGGAVAGGVWHSEGQC